MEVQAKTVVESSDFQKSYVILRIFDILTKLQKYTPVHLENEHGEDWHAHNTIHSSY
jgi:hypothetical protein